jgi:hypothetical protein
MAPCTSILSRHTIIKETPPSVDRRVAFDQLGKNTLHPEPRTKFIEDFVYLLRYVADGRANIGHLRRPGTTIHCSNPTNTKKKPPQQAYTDDELKRWRHEESHKYSDV